MPQVTGDTLVLTPNLPAGAALAEGATGALEWACVSATSATATAQRFRIGTPGTVPAQYAPPQCQ
jgi:type IV pilus assembly protein PilA